MTAIRLLQFARFPVVGAVKTRLQSALDADAACAVHCELVSLTAGQLLACQLGPVELWLDRSGAHPLLARLQDDGLLGPFLQRGEDLGERMAHALGSALSRAGRVLLVGSDCPGLDAAYLHSAAAALQHHDVVFGPAEDGGFVLVGCRRVATGLFRDIAWSRGDELLQCERQVQALGLSLSRLPMRWDIDLPQDLRRWRDESVRRAPRPARC